MLKCPTLCSLFISHIELAPVAVFRQNRSDIPSPLKSPSAPATCQSVLLKLSTGRLADNTTQTATIEGAFKPVDVLRQKISAVPSPS